MATFRKAELERCRGKKGREEMGTGEESRWETFPFKSPSSVGATIPGEGICSGTGNGLEN